MSTLLHFVLSKRQFLKNFCLHFKRCWRYFLTFVCHNLLIRLCCTVPALIYFCSHTAFPKMCQGHQGVWEVGGGMVVALLKCFPKHHSMKRTFVPEADCHPSYRRRASPLLIDSGRGHNLTLSLHIKGLLKERESQWGYITSFSVSTATFTKC